MTKVFIPNDAAALSMGADKVASAIKSEADKRGLKIEIITFDSPTDGKNAVVTKSVDFGGFGIAAATLGAAASEPVVVVGAFCNRAWA